MTRGRQRREEKGYLCGTGGREQRRLATPLGAWEPATGDAIDFRSRMHKRVERGVH
jgi:hypothetical protein